MSSAEDDLQAEVEAAREQERLVTIARLQDNLADKFLAFQRESEKRSLSWEMVIIHYRVVYLIVGLEQDLLKTPSLLISLILCLQASKLRTL